LSVAGRFYFCRSYFQQCLARTFVLKQASTFVFVRFTANSPAQLFCFNHFYGVDKPLDKKNKTSQSPWPDVCSSQNHMTQI